jgi:hypothetical protein
MTGAAQYDWGHLARLLPAAGLDVEAVNEELNQIYYRSLDARIRERQPDAKTTKRQLKRLCNSYNALSDSALKILEDQLRQDLPEAGIAVPAEVPYGKLVQFLAITMFRATLAEPSKPVGPRGIGAQARLALLELVKLYCRVTGGGKPYRDGRKWRRLEAVEFASRVMDVWHLRRRSDTAQSLAAIWADAWPPANKGKICPK